MENVDQWWGNAKRWFCLLFLLTRATLINFAGFITYFCLPSGYCQVVAIRTFVATAILNEIKDIDSKNPMSQLVHYNDNHIYNVGKMARFDETDQSVDIIIISNYYYNTNNKLCTWFVKRYNGIVSTAV